MIWGIDTQRSRRPSPLLCTVLLALAALVAAAPAQAAFAPAKNGQIVFERSSPGISDVFAINSDGSSPLNLTNNVSGGFDDNSPEYSPNGRSITFWRCGDSCDIALMSADGSGLTNLTPTATPVEETRPTFSPDGKRIAFSSQNASDEDTADIFVMNPGGSGQVNLTNTPAPTGEIDATYSPDGRTIFYTRLDAAGEHIWSMNADGSGQTQLTFGTGDDFGPTVSPDGKRLAFSRCAGPDCTFAIVVKDLGSGAETPLAGAALDDFEPAFSPDGKRIAFSAEVAPSRRALAVMDADGSGAATITTPSGIDDDSSPAWEHIYRCGGRRATIVGDDGPDKIKGTKKKDVIVANGGKDKVSGRGGSDLICLGKGKDSVNGGGGNDKCIGGKGKDKGKGCEKGKL